MGLRGRSAQTFVVCFFALFITVQCNKWVETVYLKTSVVLVFRNRYYSLNLFLCSVKLSSRLFKKIILYIDSFCKGQNWTLEKKHTIARKCQSSEKITLSCSCNVRFKSRDATRLLPLVPCILLHWIDVLTAKAKLHAPIGRANI